MRTACLILPLLLVTMGLSGCSPESPPDNSMVLSGTWQVEDVDQGGVIDNSKMTLQFATPNQLAGSTGCNRYRAMLQSAGQTFVVSEVASTRRACSPAIAQQEQRFLAALKAARYIEMDSGTWLVIRDESGAQRLKLIQIKPQVPPKDAKTTSQDAEGQAATFQCEGGGSIDVHLVGSETLRLTMPDTPVMTLQLQPSASGARYVGEGITFWDKGRKALLIFAGHTYNCTKASL